MLEKFSDSKLSEDTKLAISVCNQIINEYREQKLVLSLRQLYYQHVSHNLFPADRLWRWDYAKKKWLKDPNVTPNAEPNYDWLGTIVTAGRMAGLIDWDIIEDRGRKPLITKTWESAKHAVKDCSEWFHLDRWADQSNYVWVMVEKAALEGILIPICQKWQVPFQSQRGYGSASSMYSAGKRMQEHYAIKSKQVHVLYLGDLDPSGTDMTRDVEERLRLFSQSPIFVHRIALNPDQVRQYSPPPNPAKKTDSRYNRFVEEHGEESYELDALAPDVISTMIENSIKAFLDMEKWNKIVNWEHSLRERIVEMAETV